MKITISIGIIFSAMLGCSQAENVTFRNPVLDETLPFPSVYKHHGLYYMVSGINNQIDIWRSPILSNFRDAERREIYKAPANATNVRTPRLHSIRGDLYIYFSMETNSGSGKRLYVIKSLEPCNPLGIWSNEARLLPDEEVHSLMGTVLQYNNGDLYLIWAGHQLPDAPSYPMNLYIARMENPVEAIHPKILLRTPTMEWEKHGGAANEGPAILENHGAVFLVFSASTSASPDYCLGIMGIHGGRDPMLPSNWWNDVNHCVFRRNEEEDVYGTGHVSFVSSPNDSETWMLYHARDASQTITTRIQRLEWGEMNSPKFPSAVGLHKDLEVPQGE